MRYLHHYADETLIFLLGRLGLKQKVSPTSIKSRTYKITTLCFIGMNPPEYRRQ